MLTRVATEHDVDAALAVWRDSLAAAGRRPPAARLAEVRAQLADPAALLVVAEDDAGPLSSDAGPGLGGYALGSWDRTPALRLVDLVVQPSRRRQGVGSALAEALADAGYARGARLLLVAAADEGATAFLTALGLEPDRRGDWQGELEPPLRDVAVRLDGLRLGQLLKLAGLVDTGSEGKALLETGTVTVNGETELRRGRQLVVGDVVTARDESVRVVPA